MPYNIEKEKGVIFMTIKELRQMKGLTLAAFAKSIDIGMSTLTGYEAGKRQPGEKALAAIKEIYGVDLNETASPSAPVEAASAAPAAPAEEKAVEKKAAKKPRAKKKEADHVEAAPVEAAPAAPAAPIEEKTAEKKAEKPVKKSRVKKQTAPVEVAPTAPVKENAEKPSKKSAKKGAVAKKPAQIIIQSPMGGEITPEEIQSRIGDVDKVYVRLDQNAIYWVKGNDTGAINIW